MSADYRDTVVTAVQDEAAQAHADLVAYLSDPSGPSYEALSRKLTGLIAVLRIAAAGQPVTSLGVDGDAVLRARDRLAGMRGATARNIWLSEGVPTWLVDPQPPVAADDADGDDDGQDD